MDTKCVPDFVGAVVDRCGTALAAGPGIFVFFVRMDLSIIFTMVCELFLQLLVSFLAPN